MRLRVRELREQRGFTQVDLARRSGITRMTIWKLENGERVSTSLATLSAIARALEVPTNELFFDEDAKHA